MESSIKSDTLGGTIGEQQNLESENSPTGFNEMPQGSQGVQMKQAEDDMGESPRVEDIDFSTKINQQDTHVDTRLQPSFDPNTTMTNDLLNAHDNNFNLLLQQIYYSEKCSWFYISLLILAFVLIIVTIIDGFKVADSPMFIFLELLLNVMIGVDFACRVKLVGCERYFKDP